MPERAAKTGLIAQRGPGAVVGTSVAVPAEFGLRTGFYTFALPKERASRLAPLAAVGAGLLACAVLMIGLRAKPEPTPEPPLAVAPAEPTVRTAAVVPVAPAAPSLVLAPAPPIPDAPPLQVPSPAPSPATEVRPPHAESVRAAAPPERAPHAAEATVGFAGVWAPTDSACSPRANRGNYLPAVIDAQGAFAGETSCAFRNAKPGQGGWTVSATCANPKGRWSTQVRLVVSGNRLTWSSARGTQSYVRCGTMTRRA